MKQAGRFPQIRQAILDIFQDRRPHSVTELTNLTGSSDPRGHIRELRNAGYNIADYWARGTEGNRFKYYYLR